MISADVRACGRGSADCRGSRRRRSDPAPAAARRQPVGERDLHHHGDSPVPTRSASTSAADAVEHPPLLGRRWRREDVGVLDTEALLQQQHRRSPAAGRPAPATARLEAPTPSGSRRASAQLPPRPAPRHRTALGASPPPGAPGPPPPGPASAGSQGQHGRQPPGRHRIDGPRPRPAEHPLGRGPPQRGPRRRAGNSRRRSRQRRVVTRADAPPPAPRATRWHRPHQLPRLACASAAASAVRAPAGQQRLDLAAGGRIGRRPASKPRRRAPARPAPAARRGRRREPRTAGRARAARRPGRAPRPRLDLVEEAPAALLVVLLGGARRGERAGKHRQRHIAGRVVLVVRHLDQQPDELARPPSASDAAAPGSSSIAASRPAPRSRRSARPLRTSSRPSLPEFHADPP